VAKKRKQRTGAKTNATSGAAEAGLQKNVGWIPPATGIKINTLVSIVLALFVGWQTFQQTGDIAITLRLALVAGGSIWLVFALVLTLTKFLRRK